MLQTRSNIEGVRLLTTNLHFTFSVGEAQLGESNEFRREAKFFHDGVYGWPIDAAIGLSKVYEEMQLNPIKLPALLHELPEGEQVVRRSPPVPEPALVLPDYQVRVGEEAAIEDAGKDLIPCAEQRYSSIVLAL